MPANRIKTVEYMLPRIDGPIACATTAGTYNDSADITVYIPETTSRTILAARIEAMAYNSTWVNSSNPTGWGIRASCDGGTTWTNVTQAALFNESDENFSMYMVADVTAEFTARFSGASDTVRWGVYVTASTTATIFSHFSAKLIITYEYDDTAHTTTRVKTVRIPIESYNGMLTTTANEIRQGTIVDQIPQLTGVGTPFLPEASVVIRQSFLELYAASSPVGTTDATTTLRIDTAGTTSAFPAIDNTSDANVLMRFMWDITAEDTTTAHALYAFNTGQNQLTQLGGWLTVTYEYDQSTSTRILNSLWMGFGEDTSYVRASADKSTTYITRFIEEPGTITMVQSGIWMTGTQSTTNTSFTLKLGAQTATTYSTMVDGSTTGSMWSLVQRIDAGSFRGAAYTLARGKNVFDGEWYSATADRHANVSAILILNYTSDRNTTDGDGSHAHSVHFPLFGSNRNVATSLLLSATVNPKIIETNYWLMSAMPILYASGIGVAIEYYFFQCERIAGETPAAGWETIFSSVAMNSGENGCQMMNGAARSFFKRWPNDTDSNRMDIEGARSWRIFGNSKQYGAGIWITWHSHTFTVAGTVSGYTGDGSGLTVKFYEDADGDYIGSATTAVGGTYTFTWYDNTEEIRAVCEQTSTGAGASIKSLAV